MQVYKSIVITCLLLISHFVFSQENQKEESEESIIVGVGATLELKDALYGVNGRLYYGVNEAFCFGPEVSYFPYQNIDEDYEKSIVDLNINAHYIFELSERLGLYPLTGVNYTIETERLVDENNDSKEENNFGLNYGAGLHYKFNNTFVFGEFKGVSGPLHAEFITVGVIFNFLR